MNLLDVDVILYDFKLTKLGHLRKPTIAMIEENRKVTLIRQTRSKTHDPIDVGLHLAEDNALINSSEEDESSFMETSGSSASEAEE